MKPDQIAKAARAAVASILRDLDNRAGLSGEWGQIDTDIQHEIREIWEGLVARAFDVPAPSAPLIPQSRAEEGWLCAWCSERGTGPLPEKHRGHTGEHELVTRARAEEMVAEERERCLKWARKMKAAALERDWHEACDAIAEAIETNGDEAAQAARAGKVGAIKCE